MKTRDISLMAMMLAVIIVLGFIPALPIPILPVPIIIQNMGIMLAGSLLGAKKGSLTVLLFLLLFALGIPRGGFASFLSPSGGYLLSYPLAALFIGLGLEKLEKKDFATTLAVITLFGVFFINLAGAVYMCFHAQTSSMGISTIFLSCLTFIPGDLLKACLASYLTVRLKKII